MGHYQEKILTLKVDMEELNAHRSIMYEMSMDSQSGNWELVLMQNADRDMIGLAEFTQASQ